MADRRDQLDQLDHAQHVLMLGRSPDLEAVPALEARGQGVSREPDREDAETLIEEMLGELVELRAQVADLSGPSAPVIDLKTRRRIR